MDTLHKPEQQQFIEMLTDLILFLQIDKYSEIMKIPNSERVL